MHERPTATHEKSDEELIAEFQGGSREAFGALVGRYKDQLTNYVYRFLDDRDGADDVVQEVFLRVYDKKDSYRPIAKFSTWIYTIAANLSKTELRRRKRHSFFSLSFTRPGSEGRVFELPDDRYPSDRNAENSSGAEMIEKALSALPLKFREIVILADLQDLSYDEIAAITGLNIGTVKSRLNRGRNKLQKMLKDYI